MKTTLSTFAVLSCLFALSPASAQTFDIGPDRDNTMWGNQEAQPNDGKNPWRSNGAGSYMFTGWSAGNSPLDPRRALIHFDLSSIPAGSIVQTVELELTLSAAAGQNADAQGSDEVSLHRLLADWGEGASNAPGPEGTGANPEAGDATWIHTFFDTSFWTTPGGDFVPTPSASTVVPPVLGPYTWGSTPEMVADVQAWIDDASTNFGWILIGDESTTGTARRFNTREWLPDGPGGTPVLTLVVTPVPVELLSVSVE